MTTNERRRIDELVQRIAEQKQTLCRLLGDAGHAAEELAELVRELATVLPADPTQRAEMVDLVPGNAEEAQFEQAAEWFDGLCDRLSEDEAQTWVLPFTPK